MATGSVDAARQRRVSPRTAREPLAVTMFGGFAVARGSWRPAAADWEGRKAQRLVRFLVIHRGVTATEDDLLEALWPDHRPASRRRSLQVAVSRARRVLDAPGAASVIHVHDRVYSLRLGPGDTVDVDRFETAARAALADDGPERERSLGRAGSLWQGEPLPEERYTEWALAWRRRLADLHAGVLEALSDCRLERGDAVGAGMSARELVELDPLDEGGHRRLMVVLARRGRRGEALRQYQECCAALAAQLGIEPSAETTALHRRIEGGDRV